ncbi:MAG: NUDIX domain-containing protein [Ramlibacter sp.]|nr:NUDIX domain-containing protein [Ramlibacter sp.]
MESQAQPTETSVRAAASAVMLRDGTGGLEVFLLKRHGLSAVLAGAHVFPGGKVDPEDAGLDAGAHLDMGAPALRAALHEPQLDEAAAVALYVAALREAFEETGVLYVRDPAPRACQAAWQAPREGRTFGQTLARYSLRLEVSRLQPWSRWITPVVAGTMRKRFDTRFFLAPLPAGQIARHDNHEAVDSVWLTPRAALRQYWDRQIDLAPPQIMGLAHLARHPCVDSAMAQARRRPPPLVLPEPFELEGARMVCYPGDERHPVRQRALPGPTRLIYRNGRFEPVDGLAALFAEPR